MQCTVISPAKLNLTLHITGVSGGFHMLDSIVTTIDICDEVSVALRGDGEITVTMKGEGCEGLENQSNNAYRAAALFCKMYNLCGADIAIKKRIPVGAGLGGSSADAAGVLNALCRLHKMPLCKAFPVADATGSDTRYMLTGGWARMSGRGNVVTPLSCNLNPYFLVLVPQVLSPAAECYKRYDALGCKSPAPLTSLPESTQGLSAVLYNALTAPAVSLFPEIGNALEGLRALAGHSCMSGSGSAVFALFNDMSGCMAAKELYSGNSRAFAARVCMPHIV